ncbi:alpha-protein kinase 3 [Oncorhynchus tshawytscha]|uniref:alpha-protein kinase 3 n=1 Tax=Oncorhynchus tshawytscha TaxID=74940 RepID=UPI001C3CA2F7|nr:alpha-protein kinase 3 [Oncorhynchus tshawytscha]
MSPGLSRRSPLLQPPNGQRTPPTERRSPLLSRRKLAPTPETLKQSQEPALETTSTTKTEEKPAEKDKHNPFKAPQVIRKIRGEPFSDAAGHLKLWCQFFNVLSDSTIKWIRDEGEIAEVKRSAGDETQVALAIVQTSSRDCGVYGCTITNEYGTDTTDYLLSVDILSGMFQREDQEVGEEIEMSPLLFTKGLADSGVWGSKFFGRIMMEEAHIGEGCSHKACRVKVIYGLEPVFESGTTCYIKVKSPIAYYGVKEESNLVERNLAITQQECRLQNIAREYCKIFAAECRVIGTFGEVLEVIPVHHMYRPANTIPHATVESDLKGVYLRYCLMDATGRLVMRTGSEAALKCCTLQHWILQWTNGNLLLTRMEGVDFKITNIGISIKSKGYQSLTITENPNVFEQFVSQHKCNYYCGLLRLRSLKTQDSLQTPAKPKCSRSPLLHRKMGSSSSPQPSRKATGSPGDQKASTARGQQSHRQAQGR